MANNYFSFKQFTIWQDKSAFKVGTDGVLLGAYAEIEKAERVLDIGSGTGLISIMLAQRCAAEITAIEPDRGSFDQSCENIEQCDWHDRIKVVHSDLQSFTPDHGRFDLIVTNPPYFSNSLKSSDPRRSAARHNDSLTSGELLEGVVKFLEYNGRFQVIMPYDEGNVFIAEANQYGLYCNNILKIKPLPTSEIRRMILTFSRIKKKPVERFLTIEHGRRHEFTEEYINLTKDFYLNF